MIGAVVYRLRAENKASLIELHGRLLHGAFFKMVSEVNPEIAQTIHDTTGTKAFSSGLLEPEKNIHEGSNVEIMPGQVYKWRVCALNDVVLQILLSIPEGAEMDVGRARLKFVEAIADGRMDTGVIDEQMLIGGALAITNVRSLTFQFITPATFRRDNMDYPFPLPELVFGSLAKRWTENEMPIKLEHGEIRDIAWHIKPFKWQGNSIFGYTSKGRGITGFKGTFTYSLDDLNEDWRQIFLMLGQYAAFAGVGRLTSQGFGRVKFSWR